MTLLKPPCLGAGVPGSQIPSVLPLFFLQKSHVSRSAWTLLCCFTSLKPPCLAELFLGNPLWGSLPCSLPGLLVWSICHSTAIFLSIASGWFLFLPRLPLCQRQASAHPGPQFPFSPVGTMERLSPTPILKFVRVKAGNSRGKCMQMNMQMGIFRIYERPRFQEEGTASARLGPLNPGPCQCRKAP